MNNLQKWFLIIALWAVILCLIFAFYWIQVRPVNIRRICAKKANAASLEIKSSFSGAVEIYEAVYSDCCRKNGIQR